MAGPGVGRPLGAHSRRKGDNCKKGTVQYRALEELRFSQTIGKETSRVRMGSGKTPPRERAREEVRS